MKDFRQVINYLVNMLLLKTYLINQNSYYYLGVLLIKMNQLKIISSSLLIQCILIVQN